MKLRPINTRQINQSQKTALTSCGRGLPSRDSDSGVIMPDTLPPPPPCCGEAGAERLEVRYGVRKQGTPRCLRRRNACKIEE